MIHFVIDGGKLFFFVKDDPLGYALKPLTSNKTALRFTSRKLDIYLSKVITQKPPMRFFILDSGQKYEGKYPLYEINIHKSIQQLLKDAM
jgi:hypothetical protein